VKPDKPNATTNLKRIRIERGLTTEQLAYLAGVSKSTISKAENGHHTLRPKTVVRISKALKVSPDRILANSES